jgi:hypothetical protein
MPAPVELGRHTASCIGELLINRRDEPAYRRRVMGFVLPPWQREFVWTQQQSIKFMESVWKGMPLGTYTFNRLYGSEFDNYLIDGQQRLQTISKYLDDEFPVFGFFYSETTELDRRRFRNIVFASYICETDDEAYLKDYYNLMNFGGTAHKENERA